MLKSVLDISILLINTAVRYDVRPFHHKYRPGFTTNSYRNPRVPARKKGERKMGRVTCTYTKAALMLILSCDTHTSHLGLDAFALQGLHRGQSVAARLEVHEPVACKREETRVSGGKWKPRNEIIVIINRRIEKYCKYWCVKI